MTPDDLRLRAQRQRREFMRWILLLTMELSRPAPATLSMLHGVVMGEYPDATDLEVRRELDYLQERDLVEVKVDPIGQLRASLQRHGIDIAQYTVDCEPGIARPPVGG